MAGEQVPQGWSVSQQALGTWLTSPINEFEFQAYNSEPSSQKYLGNKITLTCFLLDSTFNTDKDLSLKIHFQSYMGIKM